jgi:autotransporter-associated beta strand protein
LIDPNNNNAVNTAYQGLVSTNVKFEENSKPGDIFGNGVYQFIAGRVKWDVVPSEVKRLLLDPISGKTIRISNSIPTVSQEIVATGTGAGGFVSVGTLVTTPKFSIGNGIQATFTQAGSLASGGVFVNNGTLKFSVLSSTKTVGNQISGSGTLEKIDAGELVLTGVNSYSGSTRLSGGVLQAANGDAIGSGAIVFNGGTLRYGAGLSKDFSSRIAPIAEGQTAAVDTGTNNVTFAAVLGGSGGFSKRGDGTLVLAAANTFTGTLGVASGSVKVGKGTVGSLAAASVNVSEGALLSFARDDAATFGGALTGGGRVEQAGSGQLALNGDGTAFTGTFAFSNGTTLLNNAMALAGGSLLFNGGTLKYGVSADDLSSRISNLSTTALVDTNAFDVTYATGLRGEAGLTKYGAGRLTLSGNNTYQGLTTVAAGTLQYTGDGLKTLGTIHTLADSRVLLTLASGTATFSGTVTGSGALAKDGNGTLTLGSSPLNSGSLTVAAGRLDLGRNVRLARSVDLKQDTILNVTDGILASTASLTLGGTLQVGNGVMFVKSLALLNTGTITLDPVVYDNDPQEAFATIFAESLQGGTIDTASLLVTTYTPGNVSGALRGPVKGIPGGSALTLLKNDYGKVVSLADPEMRLASLDAAAGVKLRVNENVFVEGNVTIRGGSLRVEAGLNASNGAVQIGEVTASGSGAVTGTVTQNGSIVARALTLTGKSNLVLEDPAALRGVVNIQVGALSVGSTEAERKDDAQ